MPAQESQQPQAPQQMELQSQSDNSRINTEQPRPIEQMSTESVGMRGGGGGDVCCGICAGLACFECFECCC